MLFIHEADFGFVAFWDVADISTFDMAHRVQYSPKRIGVPHPLQCKKTVEFSGISSFPSRRYAEILEEETPVC